MVGPAGFSPATYPLKRVALVVELKTRSAVVDSNYRFCLNIIWPDFLDNELLLF